MPISLEDANRLVAGAHARAAEIGVNVTAAVVDEGGHLIALGRMDGAPPLSPQIAEAKAVGAAMLLPGGPSLLQMGEDRPGFFSAVARLVRMPLIPGPGSIPIKRDGLTVGAVGVSGARPGQDPPWAGAASRTISAPGPALHQSSSRTCSGS